MKVKVCGMRDSENIRGLIQLQPDYIGFIFYEHSPRDAEEKLDKEVVNAIPSNIKKVGVFVNSDIDFVIDHQKKYKFDYLQLHGDESLDYCFDLKNRGYKIIKVFSIDDKFDFSIPYHYKDVCEFFLFDTRGKYPGGNSTQFNWGLLEKYDNEKPFFLSGGIDLESIDQIKALQNLNIHALDVNSKFEMKPGLKNIGKLKQLINEIITS